MREGQREWDEGRGKRGERERKGEKERERERRGDGGQKVNEHAGTYKSKSVYEIKKHINTCKKHTYISRC